MRRKRAQSRRREGRPRMALEEMKARLRAEEGNIPWMYLDGAGQVTVGVGHRVTTAAAASMLPFTRPSGEAAGVAETCSAYNAVRALAPDKLPGYYQLTTHLRLPQTAIDELLEGDLVFLTAALAHRLDGWDGYPAPAQEALLDMGFQLGPSGLLQKFPLLCAAAEGGNWDACASECHVLGASEARNQARAGLFREAAIAAAVQPGKESDVEPGRT